MKASFLKKQLVGNSDKFKQKGREPLPEKLITMILMSLSQSDTGLNHSDN